MYKYSKRKDTYNTGRGTPAITMYSVYTSVEIEGLDKPRLIFGFPSLYSGFGLSGSCTRHSGVDGKGAKETSTLKTKSPPQENLISMPKKTPN